MLCGELTLTSDRTLAQAAGDHQAGRPGGAAALHQRLPRPPVRRPVPALLSALPQALVVRITTSAYG